MDIEQDSFRQVLALFLKIRDYSFREQSNIVNVLSNIVRVTVTVRESVCEKERKKELIDR